MPILHDTITPRNHGQPTMGLRAFIPLLPTRVATTLSVTVLVCVTACGDESAGSLAPLSADPSQFTWTLPDGAAPPPVPVDNPMTAVKVELGRRLFYDTRLSGNGSLACASCHLQARSFSDARPAPVGSTGEAHTRNAQGLANVGYLTTSGWASPELRGLEAQALIPMFAVNPVELGLTGQEEQVLARLGSVAVYRDLFRRSFPDDVTPVSIANVTRALAAFERTLIALNSPLDRFRRGEVTALSAAARRGLERFNALGCPRCHLGNLFTRANDPSTARTELFVNTGLYNIGGSGAYPDRNGGLFETTHVPGDMGRMRVPSLRNVALTAPYGHDGSVTTLEDVIDNYARGGRLVVSGPHAGDGRVSPWRDRRIEPLHLTPQDKAELVAFLNALTDSSLVSDRRFANPWR